MPVANKDTLKRTICVSKIVSLNSETDSLLRTKIQ